MAIVDADRPLRVAIGEDDVLLREGIARILTDAGLEVVAQSGDADDLLRRTLAYRPDVVVTDVQMPPDRHDDGLRAAMELRRREPRIGVLILSQFCEPAYVMQLVGERPEGVGYLLKERVGDVAAFVDAVARVAAGGSALDPEVVARMLGRRPRGDPLRLLTPRERAVLAAMAEGKSNLGIAQSLLLSQASVEKHVTAIFRKLPHRARGHRAPPRPGRPDLPARRGSPTMTRDEDTRRAAESGWCRGRGGGHAAGPGRRAGGGAAGGRAGGADGVTGGGLRHGGDGGVAPAARPADDAEPVRRGP